MGNLDTSNFLKRFSEIRGPKDLFGMGFCNDEGKGRFVTYCEYSFYHQDCPQIGHYAKQRNGKINNC